LIHFYKRTLLFTITRATSAPQCKVMTGRNDKNAQQTSSSKDEAFTPRKSPLKISQVQGLRRSSRKRATSSSLSSVFATPPPSSKKSKKTQPAPVPPQPAPTLTTLPHVVTERLLLYLDVETLEKLSATCYYFDQLIAGRFLTSIDIPFNVDFNAEVAASSIFEKKPLLKMKSKKSKDEFKIFEDMPDEFSASSSIHEIIVENSPDMTDYMVQGQLALLSLDKLREVDLVPASAMEEGGSRFFTQRVMDSYSNFDSGLLRQLSRMGSLSHVTRLDVLVDHNFYLEQFMTQFPSLIELGLFITTRSGISRNAFFNEYIPRMESVVAASKAPVLKLTVLNETKRQVIKVLKNKFVERLVIKGPCTLNLVPVMENLKELEVKLYTSYPNSCTYWKSKVDDRNIHRAGLCAVNIGALYENCPKIEKFMGVEVGSISQDMIFSKWNSRIKKKFHQLYLAQGGTKEFKAWSKTRWYSRRPPSSRVAVVPQIAVHPVVGVLPQW